MMKLNGFGARPWLAAAAATVLLAGCGGSQNDALPLIKASVSVKTFSMGGMCETIPVRIVPVELRGEANKYANNRTMVLEVAMEGPTDENGAPTCNGSGETLPLAPGDWEFSAPLASGSTKCTRDIQAGGDLSIRLVDGAEGCGGPQAAPAAEDVAPAEGEAPAEGAVPAEGEAASAEASAAG
ncbi:MAG: hypothetical protein MUC71_05500 [Steroidobacteraceae bacterium]|nr:hypothetical protein [Steroidobacteraceae bacterium]